MNKDPEASHRNRIAGMSPSTSPNWMDEVDLTLKPTMFRAQNTLMPTRVPHTEGISPRSESPKARGFGFDGGVSRGQHGFQLHNPPQALLSFWNPDTDDNDGTPTLVVDEVEQLDNDRATNDMRDFDNQMQKFDEELAQLSGVRGRKLESLGGSHPSIEFSPSRWWKEVGILEKWAVHEPAFPSMSSITMLDSAIKITKAQGTGTFSPVAHTNDFPGEMTRRASACVPVPSSHVGRSSTGLPISATIRQRAMERTAVTPDSRTPVIVHYVTYPPMTDFTLIFAGDPSDTLPRLGSLLRNFNRD